MRLSLLACGLACAPMETVVDVQPEPIEEEIEIRYGAWEELSSPACERIDGYDEIVRESGVDTLALDISGSRAELAGLLDDELRTDRLLALRAAPQEAGCLEASAARPLEGAPLASAIRHAADLVGEPIEGLPYQSIPFDAALSMLCDVALCGEPEGELPA